MPGRLDTASARGSRWSGAAVYIGLAVLAYLPVLTTARGRVAADSKQYLYLDPGRLLARAPYLWQPEVHLGTVTHQNIGYLFPAGPWFWTFDRLGVPDWVAQRLWLGTILFVAGAGILFLMRTLGVPGPGRWAAAFVYMLSPYTLVFASRLSVLLLAWCMLPWLLALTIRALRSGDWRAPAVFALLVQVAGSINLTALVLIGVAPLLWILYATFVTREVTPRRALTTTARIGVLTLAVSAWWLAALSIQAGYGLNILDYSETVNVVAIGGHAGEVLRGLGNWFFYGGDRLGNWIEASREYTTSRPLLAVGYALVVLVFVSAAVVRWRQRGYFVALVVLGVVVAVGVHPYDDPSPFGSVLKSFSEGSSIGLALRNVGRAVPLVVLGGAVLVGVGVTAVADRLRAAGRRRVGVALALGVVVLAVLNLPALWNGTFYGKNLLRPERVPDYWASAIAALEARGTDSRILELPGADFASYTWGNAIEPITPGLTDRPYVARELIPYGSPPSANLLEAIDRRLQMGLLEPRAIAPLARLLSAGDVVLRSDLESDRFDLVRPREVDAQFDPTPEGLSGPHRYGDRLEPPEVRLLDERTLATAGGSDPAPVEVYRVDDPRSFVDAHAGPGLVVSGDGDGLVDIAAIGLLDADPLVRYSARAEREATENLPVPKAAALVVTDTNRRRAKRWGSLQDNVGYTERRGERNTRDPYDHRLLVFTAAGDRARTTMQQHGATVTASAYASRNLSYLPADRAARALDGDVHTAWRVGRFASVVGEWLRVVPDRPVTASTVRLVQPLDGERNRWITRVRLEFRDADGARVGADVVADLGPESRTPGGQTIAFPERRFARLDVVVEADNIGPRDAYLVESPVGFAEVDLGDLRLDEVVRMPVDLVETDVARDTSHPLVYVMTRLRNWIGVPNIAEEEARLVRELEVPSTRSFGLSAQARIANTAPDDLVDQLLGYPGPAQGGIAARSSDRIRTTLAARASSALDGDVRTAWTSAFDATTGAWIEIDTAAPVTLDRLDLVYVADGEHSVPTALRIDAGGEARSVVLPPATEGGDGIARVPVQFAPLTGSRVRVTVDAVQPVRTDHRPDAGQTAPVAIAELGIPGVRRGVAPTSLVSECREGLLEIDGAPIAVRISGDVRAAEAGAALDVAPCEADATLTRGRHTLRAAPGATSGIDLDRIVLASGAGGAATRLDAGGAAALSRSVAGTADPTVHVVRAGRTHWDARVTGVDGPFVLTLGQSFNDGWRLSVDGREVGGPRLVDGYANGWRVEPGRASSVRVSLDWAPQRRVWIALAISVLGAIVCLVLCVVPRRRAATGVEAGIRVDNSPPTFQWPIRFGASAGTGPVVRAGPTVAASVAVTIAGAVLAAPWVGLLAGVLTAVALRQPRWRWAPGLAAIGCAGLTGAYVVIQQWRYEHPAVIEWPTFFDRVHRLGLAAVILLGADLVVRALVARAATTPAAKPSGADPG